MGLILINVFWLSTTFSATNVFLDSNIKLLNIYML